jgi:HK97 family phage prohead protease
MTTLAPAPASATGIDRDNAIIRGVIVAEAGEFRSGRGQFDVDSLATVVRLARKQPAGIKSHFGHSSLFQDQLGRYLGRVRDLRLTKAHRRIDGRLQWIDVVRGDLHFSPSASNTPSGDLSGYLMTLAAEDVDALGMSMVLTAEQDWSTTPPLWRPISLLGVDVVDQGDATRAFLSSPSAALRAQTTGGLFGRKTSATASDLQRSLTLRRLRSRELQPIFPADYTTPDIDLGSVFFPSIIGYGCRWDMRSSIREDGRCHVFRRGAFSDVARSDCLRLLVGHDDDLELCRRGLGLQVREDSYGLRVEASLDDGHDHRLSSHVARAMNEGRLSSMSIGKHTTRGDQLENGDRIITEVTQLSEISLIDNPGLPGTIASCFAQGPHFPNHSLLARIRAAA